MMSPSSQDDGNIRAPSLACVVCLAVQVVAVARVSVRLSYCQLGVSARTLLDRLFVERVSGDQADSTRQLVRDAVLSKTDS